MEKEKQTFVLSKERKTKVFGLVFPIKQINLPPKDFPVSYTDLQCSQVKPVEEALYALCIYRHWICLICISSHSIIFINFVLVYNKYTRSIIMFQKQLGLSFCLILSETNSALLRSLAHWKDICNMSNKCLWIHGFNI